MASLKTRSVPAVERALAVLEALAGSRGGLALPDMARRLGLPKSSVHCLLVTLERHGYVNRRSGTNRYTLGMKLYRLGSAALGSVEWRDKAGPTLRVLLGATHMTVHLAILEQDEAIVIERLQSPEVALRTSWQGKRMDLHCTGLGKIFLAHLPDQELSRLVHERGLARHNDNTIVSLRKLREDLVRVRINGYSVDDEEDEIGIRCIGAAVYGPSGALAAALSVAGTVDQITPEHLPKLARMVREAGAAVSHAIGFKDQPPVQAAVEPHASPPRL